MLHVEILIRELRCAVDGGATRAVPFYEVPALDHEVFYLHDS